MLERCLDSEAYIRMSTEKFDELGRGWVTRSHYVTYPKTTEDWGVWYYLGQPFDLIASGV